MTRVLSFLALATLFATGVAVGGTVGPAPVYAQTEETCEQDECDPAPWWKFWASDECVMNPGYLTGATGSATTSARRTRAVRSCRAAATAQETTTSRIRPESGGGGRGLACRPWFDRTKVGDREE